MKSAPSAIYLGLEPIIPSIRKAMWYHNDGYDDEVLQKKLNFLEEYYKSKKYCEKLKSEKTGGITTCEAEERAPIVKAEKPEEVPEDIELTTEALIKIKSKDENSLGFSKAQSDESGIMGTPRAHRLISVGAYGKEKPLTNGSFVYIETTDPNTEGYVYAYCNWLSWLKYYN